jgi:hypothetical protein
MASLDLTAEGIFALNLITVIREFILRDFCPPCPPCSRVEVKMNAVVPAKAATGRLAILDESTFIMLIFSKAFPGVTFPDPDDPRVVAIKAAVDKMKAGN